MIMTVITVLLALVSIVFIILLSILVYLEIRERLSTENMAEDKHKTAVNYAEKAKIQSPLVAQFSEVDKDTHLITADNSSSIDLEKFWKKNK